MAMDITRETFKRPVINKATGQRFGSMLEAVQQLKDYEGVRDDRELEFGMRFLGEAIEGGYIWKGVFWEFA
eukprot:g79459.t1